MPDNISNRPLWRLDQLPTRFGVLRWRAAIPSPWYKLSLYDSIAAELFTFADVRWRTVHFTSFGGFAGHRQPFVTYSGKQRAGGPASWRKKHLTIQLARTSMPTYLAPPLFEPDGGDGAGYRCFSDSAGARRPLLARDSDLCSCLPRLPTHVTAPCLTTLPSTVRDTHQNAAKPPAYTIHCGAFLRGACTRHTATHYRQHSRQSLARTTPSTLPATTT